MLVLLIFKKKLICWFVCLLFFMFVCVSVVFFVVFLFCCCCLFVCFHCLASVLRRWSMNWYWVKPHAFRKEVWGQSCLPWEPSEGRARGRKQMRVSVWLVSVYVCGHGTRQSVCWISPDLIDPRADFIKFNTAVLALFNLTCRVISA